MSLHSLTLAMAVFVATNMDGLLLLAVLFGDKGYGDRDVVVGQFIGIGALVAVSSIAAMVAVSIPADWISMLGFVPLGIGCCRLFVFLANPEDVAGDKLALREIEGSRVLAVSALTIANGGDNLAAYIPLFASSVKNIPIYILLYTAMSVVLCIVGYALAKTGAAALLTMGYGRALLPVILIALGLHILGWFDVAVKQFDSVEFLMGGIVRLFE